MKAFRQVVLLVSGPSDNIMVAWGSRSGFLKVREGMKILVNQETVNDTAKLMMHRLSSREIGRDPSLVERAKVSHARTAWLYAGRPFVGSGTIS